MAQLFSDFVDGCLSVPINMPGFAYHIAMKDVNDVLADRDHVIDMGLADPSKINALGGSHGVFLTTHLIGQAPDKFAAAAIRNTVCNLPLMVKTPILFLLGAKDLRTNMYKSDLGLKPRFKFSFLKVLGLNYFQVV